MISYTRKQINRLLKLDFIRFCIVGGCGFILNLLMLTTLHRLLDLPVFISQLIAAEFALFANFLLHHNWTYKDNKVQKSISTLIIQFHATSWPAIIGSAIMVSIAEQSLHLNSFFALSLSSIIVLGWNYGWSKFVVWRGVTDKEVEESIQ